MKKRTIATILATMMAVSMLAGCGSSSETPAKEQKTEEAIQEAINFLFTIHCIIRHWMSEMNRAIMT